jgi:hypothetical protein
MIRDRELRTVRYGRVEAYEHVQMIIQHGNAGDAHGRDLRQLLQTLLDPSLTVLRPLGEQVRAPHSL